jgi:hypothetical protein
MASAFFNPDNEEIISTTSIAEFVNLRFHNDNLPKGSFDQDIDEGT